MTDDAFAYPFSAEQHLRRGRTVLRPVVRVSLGDASLVFDALVDTGCEHVLADSSVAFAAGVDLSDPLDVEEIGLGGGIVLAKFVSVTGFLHAPLGRAEEPLAWDLDVGFIDGWRPLYPCLLGSDGFMDRFTVTVSRFAQSTAIEPIGRFDTRFGTSNAPAC